MFSLKEARHSRPHTTANDHPAMPARILIIEDEAAIAETLRYALSTDGFQPLWCHTGEAALAALEQGPVDLVILDVGLPDINGFELYRHLTARTGAPVIFLTARSAEVDRIVGLELGADDYIAKPFSPREVTARVRTVLRRLQKNQGPVPSGGAWRSPFRPLGGNENPGNAPSSESTSSNPIALSPTSLQSSPYDTSPAISRLPAGLPFTVDEAKRRIRYFDQPLELSRYEYRLLRLLITRPGRVFSRDDLLYQVWDEPEASYDRTVDAHIKTLRAKLKAVRPAIEAIKTHRGSGYALRDDW